MPVESTSERAALSRFWRQHGRLVAVLTLIWGAASFVPPLFAGNSRSWLFGMPVSMWFIAELAPVTFVGIAWVYARRADALDTEYVDRGA